MYISSGYRYRSLSKNKIQYLGVMYYESGLLTIMQWWGLKIDYLSLALSKFTSLKIFGHTLIVINRQDIS